MAEAKPPTSFFTNLFKSGVNKAEPAAVMVEPPISSSAQIDYNPGHDHSSMAFYPEKQQAILQQKSPSCCCPLSSWTNADFRNVALASAIPLGISALKMAVIKRDVNVRIFFEREDTLYHKMCPHPAICTTLELATVAPLGYASYIVWKCGGFETSKTKLALYVYGFTLVNALGTLPALQSLNLRWITSSKLIVAAGAAMTAYTFGKVERSAGYWVVPFALWSAYQAIPFLFRLCPCASDEYQTPTSTSTAPKTVTVTTRMPITRPTDQAKHDDGKEIFENQ